ncbi:MULTISPECIES: hypothetical protein [Sphingomonas]|jgi:hypothetical protein|uniref:Uncharacterized protein n=2 Tax=Sphingomonas TaxID=13687 RepID=A0A7W9ASP2_9SPHN|nr:MULTISPECIES: hypothetical protein [Sphingomonas]MBB3473625.1 hypothetical protein [Sphingomonas sp. BK345]MBB5699858.1 hypothetical protein [Sphingomonas yantingensis]
MTKFKLISAAFALTLSTGAFAAVANCCADMACCKDGADCCDHGDKAKGGDHAGHAMPNMK